jgi:hypothetical protein
MDGYSKMVDTPPPTTVLMDLSSTSTWINCWKKKKTENIIISYRRAA